MKILSLLVFLSFGAYASADISKFQGHLYKKAEYDVCLKDYDSFTKIVDAVEGFTVLSGGCLMYGTENFKLEFDYIHPLASEVENYTITLADEATCQNSVKKAQDELLASGNLLVTTYCQGKELNTQFIDTTRSMVRSLNRLGKFSSLADCSNFLADLTAKTKAYKMTSFMSYCQEAKYDNTGKSYFNPIFNYISYFEIELGLITGKTLTSQSSCLNNRVDIEQNFSSSEVKIVYAYCPAAMTWEQNLQEIILFLKPKIKNKFLSEYEGLIFNSQDVCESQLNSMMSVFVRTGESVLYGYCKKLGTTSFKPSITYLQTIEL